MENRCSLTVTLHSEPQKNECVNIRVNVQMGIEGDDALAEHTHPYERIALVLFSVRAEFAEKVQQMFARWSFPGSNTTLHRRNTLHAVRDAVDTLDSALLKQRTYAELGIAEDRNIAELDDNIAMKGFKNT